jgi:putative flippase GtrA
MAPAHAPNDPVTATKRRLRGALGSRFARFSGAALAALTATEVALTICNGVFHLTATPAALVSWFAGAVVSYALSRWAWNRTGRPDVLRETIPFWAISVAVLVLLTLANKLGYHSAAWLHLTGARHVLWVDFVWLVANFGTFLLRFAILHHVLFADRTAALRPPAAPAASLADRTAALRPPAAPAANRAGAADARATRCQGRRA